MDISLRLGTADDAPELHALIERSVRGLQTADYSEAQINGALGTLLGLDAQLIRDRTYFLAQVPDRIIGCGGWSRRRTLFGSDGRADGEDALLDPKQDAVKIRLFLCIPIGPAAEWEARFWVPAKRLRKRPGLHVLKWAQP